jgi:hypothetical protein
VNLTDTLTQAAQDATDEDLAGDAEGPGQWAEACRSEIAARALRAEREAEGLPALETPVPVPELLTDAIRLRRMLFELYGEADMHMRVKQPRFRRADAVLKATEYLVGPDSPCSGKVSCDCEACKAYLAFMAAESARLAAEDGE